MKNLFLKLRIGIVVIGAICSCVLAAQPGNIEAWVTRPDRSALFEKQSDTINFTYRRSGRVQTIVVDDRPAYQTMDGFGFSLTGGSAEHLIHMSSDVRNELLTGIFTGVSRAH